jgi:hypothetical protein
MDCSHEIMDEISNPSPVHFAVHDGVEFLTSYTFMVDLSVFARKLL